MPRNLISNSQRKALRDWFNSQPERPKLNTAQQWWESKFGSRVSNGTCSRILSARYDTLDREGSLPPQSKRQRPGKWTILEELICAWIIDIEANGGHVDDAQLISEAGARWPTIAEYADQPVPKFSGGWLRRLKLQLELKKRCNKKTHNSFPSIPCRDLSYISQISLGYKPQDIYSMSETILFWKSSPWSYIPSKSVPGKKPNMLRISITLCVNSDGLDKCPPMYIGRGRQPPKALAGWSLENNGYIWSQNQNGWMDGDCMLLWLSKFCLHVGTDRNILLLLDNRHARLTTASKFDLPPNVRVEYLRLHVDGPLDCGIIRNAKALYRKAFLEYSIEYAEKNAQPPKNMINLALVWFTYAWLVTVSPNLVNECFEKSKVINTRESPAETLPNGSEKSLGNSSDAGPNLSAAHSTSRGVSGIREAFDTILQLTGHENCGISLEEYTEPAMEREFTKTIEDAACYDFGSIDPKSAPTKGGDSDHEDIDAFIGLHHAQEQLWSLTVYMSEHEKCDEDTIGTLRRLKDILDQWATDSKANLKAEERIEI